MQPQLSDLEKIEVLQLVREILSLQLKLMQAEKTFNEIQVELTNKATELENMTTSNPQIKEFLERKS